MISKQSLLVGKKYEILTINSDTPVQHPTYGNFTQHEINRINVQLINMCVAKT